MKFAHSAAAASLAIAFTAMPTMTFAQSTCCEPTTKDWPQVAGNLGTWGYTAPGRIPLTVQRAYEMSSHLA